MNSPQAATSRTQGQDDREPVLVARNVAKHYKIGGHPLHVLRNVNLEVYPGEILAILGTSGCGKSTLLHVLGWLDHVNEGEIIFDGKDRASLPGSERARLRNEVMGFVFQFYHLLPELNALENVLMPSMIMHGPLAWRSERKACKARARELLELVGLGKRWKHRSRELSGGERQRVAIARALQNKPRFLFCDEPTGNLDGKTADDVRALLWGLNEANTQTMVIVTHDARLAAQAHRVVRLDKGKIVEHDPKNLGLVEEINLD